MNQCSICCEDTKSFSEIKCVFCEYITCNSCTKRYILDPDTDRNAHCMNCKREWSRGILINYFSKSWVNKDYSKYNATRSFNREKLLLPETQLLVEKEVNINKMKDDLNIIYAQINVLKEKATALRNDILFLKNTETLTEKEKETTVKCKCPVDECRGFIVNKWKCGICHIRICSKCHSLKPHRGHKEDPERLPRHVCKDDDVETIKLLKNDTKNCPTCVCPIFKTEGCDQMWCIKCHTAFSWKTGRIETGVIHNPHYYEMQRALNGGVAPRNRGDVICGGLPGYYTVIGFLNRNNMRAAILLWETIHRTVTHISMVELQRFRVNTGLDENAALRLQYMMNKIDEESFRISVGKKLKKREKNHEVHQIFDMFVNTMIILFNNMMIDGEDSRTLVQDSFKNMDILRKYTNKELNKVADIYECKLDNITDDWVLGKRITMVID